MNTKFNLIAGIIIVLLISFSFLNFQEKEISNTENNIQKIDIIENVPVDKIEVVHFHGTKQCFSCLTVGEFALKTIQERFKDEYESGVIVFKDINIDLEENQEITQKYNVKGSSLFINGITNNEDNMVEDATVWRLVNNEDTFKSYFEGRLNTLLKR